MDFILRQQLTSDELPPWAGIVFKYPVGNVMFELKNDKQS